MRGTRGCITARDCTCCQRGRADETQCLVELADLSGRLKCLMVKLTKLNFESNIILMVEWTFQEKNFKKETQKLH